MVLPPAEALPMHYKTPGLLLSLCHRAWLILPLVQWPAGFQQDKTPAVATIHELAMSWLHLACTCDVVSFCPDEAWPMAYDTHELLLSTGRTAVCTELVLTVAWQVQR